MARSNRDFRIQRRMQAQLNGKVIESVFVWGVGSGNGTVMLFCLEDGTVVRSTLSAKANLLMLIKSKHVVRYLDDVRLFASSDHIAERRFY